MLVVAKESSIKSPTLSWSLHAQDLYNFGKMVLSVNFDLNGLVNRRKVMEDAKTIPFMFTYSALILTTRGCCEQ